MDKKKLECVLGRSECAYRLSIIFQHSLHALFLFYFLHSCVCWIELNSKWIVHCTVLHYDIDLQNKMRWSLFNTGQSNKAFDMLWLVTRRKGHFKFNQPKRNHIKVTSSSCQWFKYESGKYMEPMIVVMVKLLWLMIEQPLLLRFYDVYDQIVGRHGTNNNNRVSPNRTAWVTPAKCARILYQSNTNSFWKYWKLRSMKLETKNRRRLWPIYNAILSKFEFNWINKWWCFLDMQSYRIN